MAAGPSPHRFTLLGEPINVVSMCPVASPGKADMEYKDGGAALEIVQCGTAPFRGLSMHVNHDLPVSLAFMAKEDMVLECDGKACTEVYTRASNSTKTITCQCGAVHAPASALWVALDEVKALALVASGQLKSTEARVDAAGIAWEAERRFCYALNVSAVPAMFAVHHDGVQSLPVGAALAADLGLPTGQNAVPRDHYTLCPVTNVILPKTDPTVSIISAKHRTFGWSPTALCLSPPVSTGGSVWQFCGSWIESRTWDKIMRAAAEPLPHAPFFDEDHVTVAACLRAIMQEEADILPFLVAEHELCHLDVLNEPEDPDWTSYLLPGTVSFLHQLLRRFEQHPRFSKQDYWPVTTIDALRRAMLRLDR